MRDVEMPKAKIIERVKANMETHTANYEKAFERFRERQVEVLNEMLDAAQKHRDFDRHAIGRLPVPEEHSDDYRVALEMLGLDERDILTLTQDEFRQYYLDEWEWRRSFTANTGSYLG